jgi:hypothetical protein
MHNLIVVARNTFGSTAISPLEKTTDPKPEAAMCEAVRRSSLTSFPLTNPQDEFK